MPPLHLHNSRLFHLLCFAGEARTHVFFGLRVILFQTPNLCPIHTARQTRQDSFVVPGVAV